MDGTPARFSQVRVSHGSKPLLRADKNEGLRDKGIFYRGFMGQEIRPSRRYQWRHRHYVTQLLEVERKQ